MQSTPSDSSFRALGISTKDNVAKTGYLVKRGQEYKTWRKRWFRLHSEGILSYHKNAIDVYHPVGLIYLSEAFIESHDPIGKIDNIFVVRVDGKRYMLSAESKEERENWIKAIENVIKKLIIKMQTGAKQSSITSSPSSIPTSTKTENVAVREHTQTKQMVERLLELMSVMEDGLGNTLIHSEDVNDILQYKPKPEKDDDDDDDDDDSDSEDEAGSPEIRARGFSLSNIKQHKREHVGDPVQRFTLILRDVESVRADMKGILQHLNNNEISTSSTNTKNPNENEKTLIDMNHDLKEQLDKANEQIQAHETKIEEQNVHKNVLIKEVKNLRLQIERLKVKEQ